MVVIKKKTLATNPLYIQSKMVKMNNTHDTLYSYECHVSWFKKTNVIHVFGSTNSHKKVDHSY